MTETARFMLIKTAADVNSNKFWEAILHDSGSVHCRWGRVGANGQSKTFNGGQTYIDKKIREKEKKGYRRARVTANSSSTPGKSVGGSALSNAARNQIKHSNCPITSKLIDMLVKANIHQITTQSGGQLTVDIATGSIQLPSGMGVLTQDAIDEARVLISKIDKTKSPAKRKAKVFKSNVQDYLMLVPQVIGRSRGWIDTIYSTNDEIASQSSLLDSLEATLKTISSAPQKKSSAESVFDVDLVLQTDKATKDKLNRLYKKTWQSCHQSSSLKIKTIYSVKISTVAAAFDLGSKCGNIQQLWHGTNIANLLSILKSGLIIPRRPSHGFMFGAGLYFSDKSTKALNYASGYWSGGRNNNCFMFLADVAMGKSFTPSSYRDRNNLPRKGYDSTFAKGGESGVLNNEMIIYTTQGCNLRYLVEFGR